MSEPRRIVFLTGTRADFGKLKSLIEVVLDEPGFEAHIFATGMHMNSRYGRTVDEIQKCGYPNIYSYINHHDYDSMDSILAKTIEGFSGYVKELMPDLVVIHGDRVEALAGAIVGALNNILVAHVEGGEVSGTIDELVRHAVSKMSHVHFVANEIASKRLQQMGEKHESIFVIGSPDVDVMLSNRLPTLETVKEHYEIPFDKYGIVMFHPVTTEYDQVFDQAGNLVRALIESGKQFVVVYPNNDMGSEFILQRFKEFNNNPDFILFPSLRFEYFLVLLKHAEMIVGNSSAGIREAPYYGIPTVNIGTRQMNRSLLEQIVNTGYGKDEILQAIQQLSDVRMEPAQLFGEGKSDELFISALRDNRFWEIPKQKYFMDYRGAQA
ncbi:MAG: UDP-N-acetylglucosamine 2-epimerase (hydrolyzing) [Bacteroidetes bacterium]|nr:UDP-N-acetylglucosamine 2-epimerase (hydrolyzing) [Bacteroidota bacterium]